MDVEKDRMLVTVTYRLKTYTAEVPVDATVEFLGKQLSELTGVVLSTMRFILPRGKWAGSSVIEPVSERQSSLTLEEFGITSGAVLRMMGATAEELKEVTSPVKGNRVLGFSDEEERRRRARLRPATQDDAKARLPKGPYTFHEFRVLELHSALTTPAPAKARALLFKLACDPGIVAIMHKHKWQVGVLSELAPEGLVGISPKCLLGQNMNRGQDISLRLRTDDLQGFRKYASIKKTLLHELAHMVHDDHDENFHALDKQLNQEAIELDWTNTPGRTLSGVAIRDVHDDVETMDAGLITDGRKLGGGIPPARNARLAASQAALKRYEQNKLASESPKTIESVMQVGTMNVKLPSPRRTVGKINEPDPDEKAMAAEKILVIAEVTELDGRGPHGDQNGRAEPDPDESITYRASVPASLPLLRGQEAGLQGSIAFGGVQEPDPDDMLTLNELIKTTQRYKLTTAVTEPDPDEYTSVREERNLEKSRHREEPDPDESVHREEPDPDESMRREEPDPDESMHREEPDPDESMIREEPDPDESMHREEPDPDESMIREEPDPDESMHREEPDPDEAMDSKEPGAVGNGLGLDVGPLDDELTRIFNASNAAVARLHQAVVHIRQQATEAETTRALTALSSILRNVVNNPNEAKYKVLRKVNHRFEDQVGRFEGAVEFLRAVGFSDGESGRDGLDFFALKASDPGLFWLGLSILQPLLA